MSYQLGLKVLRKLLEDADPLAYHKAKLSPALFKPDELPVFSFVDQHLGKYQKLPTMETTVAQFAEITDAPAPEPVKYYLDKLGERFAYDRINKANLDSQQLLKDDKQQVVSATQILQQAINDIAEQQYRHKILNFGQEGGKLVVSAYYNLQTSKNPAASFPWDSLQSQTGGVMPGEVASIVGRPASGKTFMGLALALHNWRKGVNTFFMSTEMDTLSIAQRASAMYAHTNLTQLKIGGYSSNTFKLFSQEMVKAKAEPASFYVVDGNLAVDVEMVYTLCAQLNCKASIIDGAYLLRHRNLRLDRYTRVAENVELMKRYTSDLEIPTVASWQFSREAVKKDKKKGQKVGVEDIGYSDAIGQISGLVLGMMQEEGIETMQSRLIQVLKGRGGETGEFRINWDFQTMDFSEVIEGEATQVSDQALGYI